MLSRFHLVPERNGRTDRRFDVSISRVSMLTRDKNTEDDNRWCLDVTSRTGAEPECISLKNSPLTALTVSSHVNATRDARKRNYI